MYKVFLDLLAAFFAALLGQVNTYLEQRNRDAANISAGAQYAELKGVKDALTRAGYASEIDNEVALASGDQLIDELRRIRPAPKPSGDADKRM